MDLQALLARLNTSQNTATPHAAVSTATPTGNTTSAVQPDIANLPRSSLASPQPTPGASGNERSQNLLNLLRFSQVPSPGAGEQSGQHASGRIQSERTASPAVSLDQVDMATKSVKDLVSPTAVHSGSQTIPQRSLSSNHSFTAPRSAAFDPADPQATLLSLLNRSQSNARQATPQPDIRPQASPPLAAAADEPKMLSQHEFPKQTSSPLSASSRTALERNLPDIQKQIASTQEENKTLFTYTNPFESLNTTRSQITKPPTLQPDSSPGHEEPQLSNDARDAYDNAPKAGDTSLGPEILRKKLKPKVPVRQSLHQSPNNNTEAPKEKATPIGMLANNATTLSSQNLNDGTQALDESGKTKDQAKESAQAPLPSRGTADHLQDSPQDVGTVEIPSAIDAAKDAEDAWESADESPAKDEAHREVPVYTFPVKPFVSITLKPSGLSRIGLRDDGVLEISRLKKDFDQLDRSLAAATSKYIIYALVKNGGIRIIRQDDGKDRQVFKNSHDRVFHVALCTTAVSAAPSDDQAVLGVGVSGAVYYATISKEGNDLFENDALESESLVFPPHPLGDENTSGGVLKTRVKSSSRHPEFFAVGRGKSINIVWPTTCNSAKYGVGGSARKVDVEKLYKDHSLRINTGKAGKDFAFSEDDTLIVSLDKTGRLRFWDIRPMVDEAKAAAPKVSPVEVSIPLMQLATASPSEKSWPTSVLFIDKVRPYTKASALRYVLVGLKQNHTLQLWDIGLGNAVQELNFPHESDTDGICSVCYHPNSGIIAVGHPTRNSIYFIHLSAPRYALNNMSQATYLERLAIEDKDLPKPDSTACMSGLREMSFAAKGHLRSIELLPIYNMSSEAVKKTQDMLPLFELYVVHSKGVTCLNIRKDDLGWNAENKILKPINAVEAGVITMNDLRLGTAVEKTEDVNEAKNKIEENVNALRSAKKKSTSKSVEEPEPHHTGVIEPASTNMPSSDTNLQANGGLSRSEDMDAHTPVESKKAKRKAISRSLGAPDKISATNLSPRTPSPSRQPTAGKEPLSNTPADAVIMANIDPSTARNTTSDASATPAEPERVTVGISGDWLNKELKKVENAVSKEFRAELTRLHHSIQNDRNVQDSAAVARQEAVLRLVSQTLSTNVENSMSRIITSEMQQVVMPSLANATVQAVTAQVGETIAKGLHHLVPHELGTQLPVAISTAMQNPQMTRIISDSMIQKMAPQIEGALAELMRTIVSPSLKKLATTMTAIEGRLNDEVEQLRFEREDNAAKLDNITGMLSGLGQALSTMSQAQLDFQGQILQDRDRLERLSETVRRVSSGTSRQASTSRNISTSQRMPPSLASTKPTTAPPMAAKATKSDEDTELEEIGALMEQGQYEQGSIRWLQSSQPIDLFDKLFVRFTPDYLATDVSPLVAFSIGITVGNSLGKNVLRRLGWINAAFGAIELRVSAS